MKQFVFGLECAQKEIHAYHADVNCMLLKLKEMLEVNCHDTDVKNFSSRAASVSMDSNDHTMLSSKIMVVCKR